MLDLTGHVPTVSVWAQGMQNGQRWVGLARRQSDVLRLADYARNDYPDSAGLNLTGMGFDRKFVAYVDLPDALAESDMPV